MATHSLKIKKKKEKISCVRVTHIVVYSYRLFIVIALYDMLRSIHPFL